MNEGLPDHMTLTEVARLAGISRDVLRARAARGQLPTVRRGPRGRRYVERAVFEHFFRTFGLESDDLAHRAELVLAPAVWDLDDGEGAGESTRELPVWLPLSTVAKLLDRPLRSVRWDAQTGKLPTIQLAGARSKRFVRLSDFRRLYPGAWDEFVSPGITDGGQHMLDMWQAEEDAKPGPDGDKEVTPIQIELPDGKSFKGRVRPASRITPAEARALHLKEKRDYMRERRAAERAATSRDADP